MEHINQLIAWQAQLDANPGAEYADIDVARRLIKHGIEAIESARRADKRARLACIQIVDDYVRSCDAVEAIHAIRATIPEDPT